MTGLSWPWIALMLLAPLPLALLVAYPVWRTRQFLLANIMGSVIIFTFALALIFREHAELDAVTMRCIEAGYTCWAQPSPFTRFAIYASLGLIEVILLFAVSVRVESALRNRDYAPEWRR